MINKLDDFTFWRILAEKCQMQFSQIKETCLYVKNLRKTMQFYQDLLGFEMISYVKESHIFFRIGNSILLCFLAKKTKIQTTPPAHFGYGSMHVAFEAQADEYEQLRKHIESLGIPILYDQIWERGHKSFYFNDPDGHLLEVVEPGLWDY